MDNGSMKPTQQITYYRKRESDHIGGWVTILNCSILSSFALIKRRRILRFTSHEIATKNM